MSQVISVYCDESCHLEHDRLDVMVLGAVWCSIEKAYQASRRLREIKEEHGLPRSFELKWAKVSPAQEAFYQAVMNYFYSDDALRFRALIVPDKSVLDHSSYQFHRHPMYKEKVATFWHISSEGKVEEERTPDLRRCERIEWPRAVIEHCKDDCVKIWESDCSPG